ncbi:hypothetical protein ASU31_10670 [Pedobacter ginsenosidimutans]|uniref:Uncharacterized protein n=1 Tax=Pedobacter ginsenosidimutans TaxID=687842 RepID=A0A0T5VQ36_9SPHI|nr:hypothetical protein ASU31_10670 [Pedobacter ginsenosidimutans]
MKYETLCIMVRVTVHADHTSMSDMIGEIESQSSLMMSDTANINILETEILLSRIRNPKLTRHEKSFIVPHG